MADLTESYISVGRVERTHGTKGWVQIYVYSMMLERFDDLKVIYLESATGVEGKIISDIRKMDNVLALKLKDVDDRETARELVKKELLVPDSEKIDLPQDNYFIHDLIGLNVIDVSGNKVGKLQEVMQMGGNDVYVIRDGEKETLIPAVEEFVKDVDLEKGKLVVVLQEEV